MNPNLTDVRLLIPERIWLEPEQIEQAGLLGHQAEAEPHQWQIYLNALALLGLQQWLHQRLPDQTIQPQMSELTTAGILQVDEFKLCILAAEHFLDDVVLVPQAVIDKPELIAHFCVAVEVIEEQEEVIIRGFLRYDQLVSACDQAIFTSLEGACALPLSCFDPEPNHLLCQCRFLEPEAISLPVLSNRQVNLSAAVINTVYANLTETRTKLSRWLEGAFDETWQVLDALVNPQTALALSTRNLESSAKRGKLLNLGVQLGHQSVALLITLTPETDGKLGVLAQLHPTSAARMLPPQLKLSLFSKLGNLLQAVEAREQDSYIQLKPFRGEPGQCFSLEISLGETRIREEFEL